MGGVDASDALTIDPHEKGTAMSFRDNLQHLRATHNMTQEQLAMLVGVSRQSVTKWESERAYPEMDKLLKLCQIFDCSLDELVQGDLTSREAAPGKTLAADAGVSDTVGYVERVQTHARNVAAAVMCFVGGSGLGLLLAAAFQYSLPEPDILIVIGVLVFVVIGLLIVIPEASRHSVFMHEHPYLIDFFTAQDRAQWSARTAREIAVGVGVIIAGVIVAIVFGDGNTAQAEMAAGIMMLLIAAGAGLVTHGGILSDMTDIEEYNVAAFCELTDAEAAELLSGHDADERARYMARRRMNHLVGLACAAMMILATVVALCLLFIPKSDWFWVPWPVGGVCCGLIAVIAQLVKGVREGK